MNDTFFLEQIHKGIYVCLSVLLRYFNGVQAPLPSLTLWLQT